MSSVLYGSIILFIVTVFFVGDLLYLSGWNTIKKDNVPNRVKSFTYAVVISLPFVLLITYTSIKVDQQYYKTS